MCTKILFLPKHSKLAASSRYRTYQYLDYLKENGIMFDVYPLFDEKYLEYKYKIGKENKFFTAKSILNRIYLILFKAYKYDILVIEKELLPYFPPIFEYILKIFKIPYILDYDDAVWHFYDSNKSEFLQNIRINKFSNIIKNSSAVICGSQYIYDFAIKSRGKNVFKIPTVIDSKKYRQKEFTDIKKLTIGWIGSPGTSKYILEIDEVLRYMIEKYHVQVRLIGFDIKLANKLKSKCSIIEWSEETEVDEILKFDIGIMPLVDSNFEQGKCGFKLIQYMGCGIPVIASPVGENNIIVRHGVNGFLASDSAEWIMYLEKFINEKNLLNEFGQNGFEQVIKNYTLQSQKENYLNVINSEMNIK